MFDRRRRDTLISGAATLLGLAVGGRAGIALAADAASAPPELHYSEAEWHQRLSAAQYAVLRDHGTERPFSSPLDKEKRDGVFNCAGCALPLFSSKTKFDSGTGWPSFWKPLPNAVNQRRDTSLGMVRDEVNCRRCAGHLGHVFDDGPAPTGLRYCMNGIALSFVPA